MKYDKKKVLFIVIGIVLGILLLSGGTYAWFKWRSTNKSVNVSLRINDSTVQLYYDGGSNVTGELEPTLTKEEGISKTVTAYSNNSSVYLDFWLKLNTLPNALKDSTFKWEMYKDGSLVCSGDFTTSSISSATSNGTTDYLLVNNLNISNDSSNPSSFTLYLWIDGNVVNNYEMAGNSINFDLYATGNVLSLGKNAASYITNLYTTASKSTARVNNITYNLAPSVGLMNDRLGSSSVGADAGNIRYYGANPNNYVWLGDTFTSAYTYTSNGTSITRAANSKKLWRIIGVFDGRLKLITADPMSTQGLSWDTSANTAGGNSGYGINQWGPSGTYEGADLMRLLNPGYEGDSINNSLYWTKGVGTVYTGQSNATTANISFANTGLSQSEKDKIDTAVWYLGAYNGNVSYVNVQYAAERQSATLGKICTSGNKCNDTVERTSTWNGKVGLMYPSDYGYATDLSTCAQTLLNYDNSSNSYACRAKDWLYNSSFTQWTISPRAYSSYADLVFVVDIRGYLSHSDAYIDRRVRPAVYLKSGVIISGGNGTESDPYILN